MSRLIDRCDSGSFATPDAEKLIVKDGAGVQSEERGQLGHGTETAALPDALQALVTVRDGEYVPCEWRQSWM